MVGQHDAAGAHANRRGALRDIADQHGRGRAGDAWHVVMFGQPEAPVAETFGMLRQRQRVVHGVGRLAALRDG
jgi:hypothetical protein